MGTGCLGARDRDGLVRDQASAGEEALLERAGLEGVPFRGEALLDLAIRLATVPEDEATRVAEGAGIALGGPGFRGGRRLREERVSDLGRRHRQTAGTGLHGLRAPAHDVQEPADVVTEEERDGDRRRDDRLDDQAAGSGVDVREFRHVRRAPVDSG